MTFADLTSSKIYVRLTEPSAGKCLDKEENDIMRKMIMEVIATQIIVN